MAALKWAIYPISTINNLQHQQMKVSPAHGGTLCDRRIRLPRHFPSKGFISYTWSKSYKRDDQGEFVVTHCSYSSFRGRSAFPLRQHYLSGTNRASVCVELLIQSIGPELIVSYLPAAWYLDITITLHEFLITFITNSPPLWILSNHAWLVALMLLLM